MYSYMALSMVLVISFCLASNNVNAKYKTLLTEKHHFLNSENMMMDAGFDCVDIYKQPSLQHPLLKNHKIQLYPTFARNIVPTNSSYDGKTIEECPTEKVPFFNTTKKHQIEGFRPNSPNYHSVTLDTTQPMTFHGGHAFIGAYNLQLQEKQYSISGIWVQNGPPSDLNSIFVGLGVNPGLYGDSKLHLTARWKAGRSGCFDTNCPGFVQVYKSKTYILGMEILPVSKIGSLKKTAVVTIIKQDKSTGHWWLCINSEQICLGYWPKELFSHLNSGASIVRFGGETYTPPVMDNPPMGSGRLPQEKVINSGFMSRIEIINSEYNETDVHPENMKINKGGNLNCYDLLYHGYEGKLNHQAFLYGGPGGKSC
ncbi:protein neprosin-like [Vicia villosa]|uniref:protein neprosin-like n=1 Tax=Vicia villosa TaxID=3911 RepID=UPI00273B813F|nr:protein neprosin-like [Vicia villosa]